MPFLLLGLVTGATVVIVTLIADRLGGRVGGLLATAPVISTFSLVWILNSHRGEPVYPILLSGNFSVIASYLAIVGYFLTIKWTKGNNLWRVILAETAFFGLYVCSLLLIRKLLPLEFYLFSVNLGIAGLLSFTFRRWRVETPGPEPEKVMNAPRLIARFLVGLAVVFLTLHASRIDPVLGGAIAVFPGILATSLGIMGVSHSAPFSARATQSAIPGILSILLFILGFWTAAPLLPSHPTWGLVLGTILAWVQYFLGLVFFTGIAERFAPATTLKIIPGGSPSTHHRVASH